MNRRGKSMQELKDIFTQCDVDRDGRLKASELRVALQLAGADYTRAETELLIRLVDTDHDSLVTCQEFTSIIEKDYLKNIEALFKIFDSNGDGFLNESEVAELLKQLGRKISSEELTDWIARTQPDGLISLEQLKHFQTESNSSDSSDDEDEIREIFDAFDTDRDGRLNAADFKFGMLSLNAHFSEEASDLIIKLIDKNGDGHIDFEEFRALKTQQFDEVSLFKVFDADGDGLISKREVREVYRKLGETISEEVLNEMLEEVDSNQDGQISFEEFIAFRDKFPSKF